jgi:hypothetical protein
MIAGSIAAPPAISIRRWPPKIVMTLAKQLLAHVDADLAQEAGDFQAEAEFFRQSGIRGGQIS